MTRSDKLSFIGTPYFLGAVGIVVGICLALTSKDSPIGYMAMFAGWICLCLGGTNALLVRILAKLEGGSESGRE